MVEISNDVIIKRMSRAYLESTKSVAKRLKVGACLDSEGIVLVGHNHMPMGMEPECEFIEGDSQLISKPDVIHAEMDCILECARVGIPTHGATLYITDSPCLRCAQTIVRAGITTVVYNRAYRIRDGLQYLESNGVKVIQDTNEYEITTDDEYNLSVIVKK